GPSTSRTSCSSAAASTTLSKRSCRATRFQRFKPHPAPYELAIKRVGSGATLVAAHGWDVLGARAAGLDAVWIDREEREWPFPFDTPPRAADLVGATQLVIARS